MPRYYYWDKAEKELHNTPRHQLIKEELYRYASLPKEEFKVIIEEFRKRHPGLFKNKLKNFYNMVEA